MKAVVGVRSDVGRVRDGNEDSYFVRDPFFGVADGMGGHVAGEVASQTAVQVITSRTEDSPPQPDSLRQLMREANRAIWEKAEHDPSLRGMGTTCTLLLLRDRKAHFAHVGDSRAYLLRDGNFSQVTEDHTLVQRLVNEGRLQREEAERHPQRNIITRSLGPDSDVQVDTFSLDARDGDRFLLCSDGLNSMIDDRAMAATLNEASSAQAAADKLVELANEAGGEDNITVIVIDIVPDSERATGETADTAGSDRARNSAPAGASPSLGEPDVVAPVSASADLLAIPGARSKLKPRWGRIAVAALLILLILGAGGYLGFRYFVLENSFFVGVDPSGAVTIYRGLPGEVAGVELHEEEQATDLALADLPAFLQDNVRDGIDADSLDDAQQRVADLQARAQDKEFRSKPRTDENGKNASSRKKDRNG